MGSSLAIFFLINNFRRFHIKCAQRKQGEAKQQFSIHSKRKLLTPGEILNHLSPYNVNSKGDNLRQVEFRNEFDAVCWRVPIKQRCGFTHRHQRARHLRSVECRLPCAKSVSIGPTEFRLRIITPLLMTAKQSEFAFCRARRLTK